MACLLGGAVGDALGYRVEFLRWTAISRQFGERGIAIETATGPLVTSDDTQMTLFTLEGMARSSSVENLITEVRAAYLDWYTTQTEQREGRSLRGPLAASPVMQHTRAPGTTCLSALMAGGRGSTAQPVNDSKGCGGVMRTAPIGFLPESVSDGEVFRLAAEAAALTHGHPDGYLPAGAMAVLAREALRATTWRTAVTKVLDHVRQWPKSEGTAASVEGAVRAAANGAAARERLRQFGEGWVGEEALAIGLYAAVVARTFEECVELAANHDGDSDSTASIAGQLWGARWGLTGISWEAVARIDVIEPLMDTWQRYETRIREASF